MGRVIQLSDYKARRAGACSTNGPPSEAGGADHITIIRNVDGTRTVTFGGRYANDEVYAIEALSEVVAALAGRIVLAR